MKARQLIGHAAFGPDVLKVIGQAFDEAWAAVEPSVGSNPLSVEAARLRLANIVLTLADEDTRNAEPLKRAAIRIFELKTKISN